MSLPDLSVVSSDVSFVPSVVYNGVSGLIQAVIRNLGEAPVQSFVVRFLVDETTLQDWTVSVAGEGSVAVNASWTPTSEGVKNVSVVADPQNMVIESSEGNNRADKGVTVYSLPAATTTSTSPTPTTTTTTVVFIPDPPPITTTIPSITCVMPGNSPQCNEVTLLEVVEAINEWAEDRLALNDVIALINSWADPSAYPPG